MKRVAGLVFLSVLVFQQSVYGASVHFGGPGDVRQSRTLVSIRDKAPAPIGGLFAAFKGFALNTRGEIAFLAKVRGGKARGGLFLSSPEGLIPLVALGQPTPLGGVFGDFIPSLDDDLAIDSVFLSDAGTVAFGATVIGGSASGGIFFVDKGGQIEKVAAVGDESPMGQRFADLRIRAINEQGDIAFTAKFSNGHEGIFLTSGGLTQKVAATGDQAPGGGIFVSFGSARLNRAGELAFIGEMRPPSNRSERNRGIFLFTGGVWKRSSQKQIHHRSDADLARLICWGARR